MGDKNIHSALVATAVVLPADCRMAAAASLQERLLEVLESPSVALDGSAVERMDTATLQVLVLFFRETRACGNTVSWLGASAILHEAASTLGLSQAIDLPALAPA